MFITIKLNKPLLLPARHWLNLAGLLTWVERKQAAVMSDRIGANRAYIKIPFTNIKLVWLGLFHGMADGLKMLLKENFKPKTHDALGYFLAPFIVICAFQIAIYFYNLPFMKAGMRNWRVSSTVRSVRL